MGKTSKDNVRAARLVLTAIRNIHQADGATIRDIKVYIRDKFPKCQPPEVQLRKVLDKAVAFGAVTKNNRRYQLGNVFSHIVQSRRRRRSKSKGGKGHKRRRRRRKH